MKREIAIALIDQLCRNLPTGGTDAADDFDYGWFRERVAAVAIRCEVSDQVLAWQHALWRLDEAHLLPEDPVRRHAAH